MKKLVLGLLAGAGIVALVNSRIDAVRTCGCRPNCWCQQPILRHFRWILPFHHRSYPSQS
jgi:hypothetical protein